MVSPVVALHCMFNVEWPFPVVSWNSLTCIMMYQQHIGLVIVGGVSGSIHPILRYPQAPSFDEGAAVPQS